MPTTPAEDVIASCSFCGKPHTSVERLVAGPGVYICNECVALCAAIVEEASQVPPEESSRRRSQYENRPNEEILAMLPALVGTADRIEAELVGWVRRLRERGSDWQGIAAGLGMSADAARRRFGAEGPQ